MSAMYIMKYAGQDGLGGGTVYIGKGVVVGVDVIGGRYEGKYVESDGRMKGTIRMTSPPGGAKLVTGQTVEGGATFDLDFDLSLDFANGKPQRLVGVGGRPLDIIFEKVTDLPE